MCVNPPYILLQLRGTTRIDPPHSIFHPNGLWQNRRGASTQQPHPRPGAGVAGPQLLQLREGVELQLREGVVAGVAGVAAVVAAVAGHLRDRAQLVGREDEAPLGCVVRPAERTGGVSATSGRNAQNCSGDCADCVPRIAPTAPNRCDADLADTTAADTENAHYTRREPGVRMVDSKVTSTQDSIQVVSRHCLCVTHTGFGLSPGSRQRLKSGSPLFSLWDDEGCCRDSCRPRASSLPGYRTVRGSSTRQALTSRRPAALGLQAARQGSTPAGPGELV